MTTDEQWAIMREKNKKSSKLNGKVALITGAAVRVGAAIACTLHTAGMNIVLHYRNSEEQARALQKELEQQREASVALLQADLLNVADIPVWIAQTKALWGRLDVLVNNASSFYPTPFEHVDEVMWNDLLGSNVKAPFFLAQAAAPILKIHSGTIVNIVDIHANRPLKGHSVYCIAKAGLVMLTKSLAQELAPKIRVNAVAPGAILWPTTIEDKDKEMILNRIPMRCQGQPEDIAAAVLYLVRDALYTTGQVLVVDGGRTVQD